jgi:hypothetical protein
MDEVHLMHPRHAPKPEDRARHGEHIPHPMPRQHESLNLGVPEIRFERTRPKEGNGGQKPAPIQVPQEIQQVNLGPALFTHA